MQGLGKPIAGVVPAGQIVLAPPGKVWVIVSYNNVDATFEGFRFRNNVRELSVAPFNVRGRQIILLSNKGIRVNEPFAYTGFEFDRIL